MRKLLVEVYGCQMNVADAEVVAAFARLAGYERVGSLEEADAIVMMTCSVRASAERKTLSRLMQLKALRAERERAGRGLVVGILGCMAERMKEELLAMGADLVAGPDSYRLLPDLLAEAALGHKALDTELRTAETYADLVPLREGGRVGGYVSITRGCDNRCHYCVVPLVRGRERSRDPESILREVADLRDRGYKEVTLLGQNVNSYRGLDNGGREVDFPSLLSQVAEAAEGMRVRFTTSHPKDMSDETLRVIATTPNVCRHIHLPVQSGSTRVLRSMNRKYTREWYLGRVEAIRRIVGDCGLTTDIFVGYPTETEEDYRATLSLVEECRFDSAFTFKYSQRPGTWAAEHLPDSISDEVKTRRLEGLIALQNSISLAVNLAEVGRERDILVEGGSRRSERQLMGRTEQGKTVVVDVSEEAEAATPRVGDCLTVRITGATSATLRGEVAQGGGSTGER